MNLLPWAPGRPERTEVIHELTQAAFAPYATLARPSGALAETVDAVGADLAAGGGLIAYDRAWSTPLGALRWRVADDHLWVKRVAVHPASQGRGVGNFLMDACRGVCHAVARDRIRLGVRHALGDNRRWYERRGYRPVVEHDDWSEYEATVEPLRFAGERVPLRKFSYPDHLQAVFDLAVVEESAAGWWAAMPRFLPHLDGPTGHIAAIAPEPVVVFLPAGEWWVAAFSRGRQRLKVDICTPALRTADGGFEFRDLCLDVVVRDDEPPRIVDQDELADAGYDDAIDARTRATADEVLRRVAAGEEPFATEGYRRLDALSG